MDEKLNGLHFSGLYFVIYLRGREGILMWWCGLFLTHSTIQEKSKRLKWALNLSLPSHKLTRCNFSNELLNVFKKTNNIKSHKCRDKKSRFLQRRFYRTSNSTTISHSVKSGWYLNAYKFGLNYTAASTSTIRPAAIIGRKNSKDRVTFLVCMNVDGFERLPSLIIGLAIRPRFYRSSGPNELELYYYYSTKAWMTSEIFYQWLNQSNKKLL